jgi:hypothetical protein
MKSHPSQQRAHSKLINVQLETFARLFLFESPKKENYTPFRVPERDFPSMTLVG